MLDMNSFEVMLVLEDLKKQGIEHYSIQPGNDCIWVSYGLVNSYYIFRGGKIAEVQFD
jgi:hypothetical protein